MFYQDTDADNATATVSSSAGGTWTEYAFINEEAGTTDLVAYLFYSKDFVDGAQTLSVTYSTAVTIGGYAAYTCTGVRTSNPWRGTNTESAANGALSTSIDVPSALGDLVVDNTVVAGLGAGVAPTADVGQTEMYNTTPGNDNLDGGGSTKPGAAGNVTMGWASGGTSERWVQVGGSLVPASTRRAVPPIFFQ